MTRLLPWFILLALVAGCNRAYCHKDGTLWDYVYEFNGGPSIQTMRNGKPIPCEGK